MQINSLTILEQLIAFDTTSYRSNLALIEYVQQLFEQHQIHVILDFNAEQNKANLFASTGQSGRGILLSGHSDVVPIAGQQWDTPAFQATIKQGQVYGRGTADMKGFLACAIVAMLEAAKLALKRPLQLCISYDEEIGCIGVRGILAQLQQQISPPLVCIIGEPTMMHMALAHKGKTAYRATCHGQEGHSSLAPRFQNAIYTATALIQSVQHVQANLAAHGVQDRGYDIPYTTLHVGKISGGTALNIVPNQCVVDYEIRHLAQDDCADIQADILAALDATQHQVSIEETIQYPGLLTSPTVQAVSLLQALLPANTQTTNVSFGTEGGLFQHALNCPVVVCGPGDIAVAHQPNEHVALTQLAACDAFLAKLIGTLMD